MAAPPASAPASLLVLPSESKVVAEHLRHLLDPERLAAGLTPVDTRVGDFDGCYWRIEVEEAAPTVINVCVEVPNFADMAPLGVETHLQRVYGPMFRPARPGASASVAIDTSALGGSVPDVISKAASLRRHVLAFPVLRALSAVAAGKGGTEPAFALRTRPREPVYVLSRPDRVAVIFHLDFPESTDRAIARVVAQELTEAYRAVNHAPPCSWSEKEPPQELRGYPGGLAAPMSTETGAGYITFTLFATSYKTEAQREAVAAQLSMFRDFLQYHLKAAKTYLHARMRSRAEALQKVLNRAVPEDPFAEREKKTASGRTFKQGSAAAGSAAGTGGPPSAGSAVARLAGSFGSSAASLSGASRE